MQSQKQKVRLKKNMMLLTWLPGQRGCCTAFAAAKPHRDPATNTRRRCREPSWCRTMREDEARITGPCVRARAGVGCRGVSMLGRVRGATVQGRVPRASAQDRGVKRTTKRPLHCRCRYHLCLADMSSTRGSRNDAYLRTKRKLVLRTRRRQNDTSQLALELARHTAGAPQYTVHSILRQVNQ